MPIGIACISPARHRAFDQSCHTDACPTAVATQNPLRQQALAVPDKTERVRRFHQNTLKALKELVQAAGLESPAQIPASHVVRRKADHGLPVRWARTDALQAIAAESRRVSR